MGPSAGYVGWLVRRDTPSSTHRGVLFVRCRQNTVVSAGTAASTTVVDGLVRARRSVGRPKIRLKGFHHEALVGQEVAQRFDRVWDRESGERGREGSR